ncbi:MAG TPA: TetR/AcrR family transcriptional regulator [Polyangia bacterium]|jgi:AcrR family transcriptional regulator|nr:TetR/AcrR family transcriptional regulator [Polyangia bacterium]
MAAQRRVRLQIDERRARLLELGIKLFSNHSYDDISIDDVAQAAGMSKGLLYHYFGGKREFYVETIRQASSQLLRMTEPDPKLQPGARLRAAVDAHLNYVQEHGPVYAAIYRGGAAVAKEMHAILEEHREVVMQYFLRDFRISKPRPVLRAALRAWIAMVEGACLDWIVHPELKRDHLREILIAGYAGVLAKAVELDPKLARALDNLIRKGHGAPG